MRETAAAQTAQSTEGLATRPADSAPLPANAKASWTPEALWLSEAPQAAAAVPAPVPPPVCEVPPPVCEGTQPPPTPAPASPRPGAVSVPSSPHGSLLFLTLWLVTTTLLARYPAGAHWQRWTLARLQQWLEEEFRYPCSKETIRRVLTRLKLSWKKCHKLLAKACPQQRQRFLRDFRRYLALADKGELLLVFLDEAHIHLDADLGHGWAQRGLPFFVHSDSPGLQKCSFYGFYLYNYQAVRIWPAPRANSDHTVAALTRLQEQFPERPILLVLDGASYHRTKVVLDKATELNISLLPLPAYSPDLMPVESLWRWLRQEVTGMTCHLSIPELITHVADFVWAANMDPCAIVSRLHIKTHLDPQEEKLRFSNGF
jgi:transposase